MNNLQKYPLDAVVTTLQREAKNTVKATFRCTTGHATLYHDSDVGGYGMMVYQADRIRTVSPGRVDSAGEAHRLFVDHVLELLHEEEFACPNCNESRVDKLKWIKDDTVQCETCAQQYTPPGKGCST